MFTAYGILDFLNTDSIYAVFSDFASGNVFHVCKIHRNAAEILTVLNV